MPYETTSLLTSHYLSLEDERAMPTPTLFSLTCKPYKAQLLRAKQS